jgi:hypothetical protein
MSWLQSLSVSLSFQGTITAVCGSCLPVIQTEPFISVPRTELKNCRMKGEPKHHLPSSSLLLTSSCYCAPSFNIGKTKLTLDFHLVQLTCPDISLDTVMAKREIPTGFEFRWFSPSLSCHASLRLCTVFETSDTK